MVKPSIRHSPDGWTVSRPGYGFGADSVTVYSTWRAALGSLSAPSSGSPVLERAPNYSAGPWGTRPPVRISASAT